MTTVSSPAAQARGAPAAALGSRPVAPNPAAAADSDSDDGLELVGEQSLDEVLEVSLVGRRLVYGFLPYQWSLHLLSLFERFLYASIL